MDHNLVLKSIMEIYREDGSLVLNPDIKMENSINKYSSKKNSIWHISLNGKHVSKKDVFTFKYRCPTCEAIHSVATTQFLRRMNNSSVRCYLCRNQETTKRQDHSKWMRENNPQHVEKEEIVSVKKTPHELEDESVMLFKSLDDDFQANYFSFHLTKEDYTRISKNVISFHNGHLVDICNYEYFPIFRVYNQMRFSSMFYDKVNNMLFKAHQPIMKCDNCGLSWRASSLDKFKNCYKILCKDCLCTNKIYKLRRTKNCTGNTVMYQSKLELKFVDWCNSRGIIVENGPKVEYKLGEKSLMYRVDFSVNNILVEIKDDHIWHRRQVESGKWKCKEDAVCELVRLGIYKAFILLTPKNWNTEINKI